MKKTEIAKHPLRVHVEQIADDHRVVIVFDHMMKPEDAVAVPPLRMVMCYPVMDETTYMIAMHELGHLIAPGGTGPDDFSSQMKFVDGKMQREDIAWGWARTHALVWTDVMERWADWARETYRRKVVDTCKATYIRPQVRPISEWS